MERTAPQAIDRLVYHGPRSEPTRTNWNNGVQPGPTLDVLRMHRGHGRVLDKDFEPADPLPISPARAPPQTVLPLGDPADASADSSDAVDPMPNWDAYIAD